MSRKEKRKQIEIKNIKKKLKKEFEMSEYRLIQEILSLSVSKEWDIAKNEWEICNIQFGEGEDECLCGKKGIKQLCFIHNDQSGRTVIIGSCCVKKFLGIRSDKIFTSIKMIKKDLDRSLNEEAIEFAREKHIINDWEENFYKNTWRKRKLSAKQKAKRRQINQKILEDIE